MFIKLTNKFNKKFLLNTDFIMEVEQIDSTENASMIFTVNNTYPVKESLDEILNTVNDKTSTSINSI
jgi:uncharacterized protein YlzI (FlbEa/FlbD family)